MSEAHRGGLASSAVFYSRVRRSVAYSLALIALALAVGTLGYCLLFHVGWIDGFHQAAMLLAGMGPVLPEGPEELSAAAKIFDSLYALLCGVVLIGATGLLFAPVIHRVLHRFHLEDAGGRR